MSSFGKNLAYYRNKKGLTQDDLARLLSVSKDLIIAWEKDQREPSEEQLEKIAHLFKIDRNELSKIHKVEKTIPVYSSAIEQNKGKLVGICSRCGKSIYSKEKYGIGDVKVEQSFLSTSTTYEYDSSSNQGKDYFCENCCKEIQAIKKADFKKELSEEKRGIKKSLIASIVFGLLFASLVIASSIIVYFLLNEALIAYLIGCASFIVGYYVFSFSYCFLLKRNWINETICSFARSSFIKFPKKIMDNDALGVLKTGFIKAIFLGVNYLIDLIILLVLIVFLAFVSVFYWPKAKKEAISYLEQAERKI